jgi:hypothetical protein
MCKNVKENMCERDKNLTVCPLQATRPTLKRSMATFRCCKSCLPANTYVHKLLTSDSGHNRGQRRGCSHAARNMQCFLTDHCRGTTEFIMLLTQKSHCAWLYRIPSLVISRASVMVDHGQCYGHQYQSLVTIQKSTSSRLLPGSSCGCCIHSLHTLVHKQCHISLVKHKLRRFLIQKNLKVLCTCHCAPGLQYVPGILRR